MASTSQRLLRREERKPLLGVIACNRTLAGEPAASVMRRYLVSAANYMDVSLVIIPSLPSLIDAPHLASIIDGCLLTGSPTNIAVDRYDEIDVQAEGPFDSDRDEVAHHMIEALIANDKPIFGICRGLQEINVALGGTLQRDLSTGERDIMHHAPSDLTAEAMFEHSHKVTLAPGGILEEAFQTSSLVVNSVHYQGIDRLASGLAVEATAPDGIVEAVSGCIRRSPVLAVQWHPEWCTDANPNSQALFRLFGETIRGKSVSGHPTVIPSQEENHA